MNDKKITILIIFVSIIIMLFMILAILAYFQQKRINNFLNMKRNFHTEIEAFKTTKLPLKLERIDSGWEMPEGEICYLKIQVETYPYKLSKKKNDQQYVRLLGQRQVKYQFNIVKKTFNFKLFKNKVSYQAVLYVTNKRLVISNNKESKLWNLNAIDKIEFSIFNITNTYYKGIILYLNNSILHIITNNLKLSFLLHQLIFQ